MSRECAANDSLTWSTKKDNGKIGSIASHNELNAPHVCHNPMLHSTWIITTFMKAQIEAINLRPHSYFVENVVFFSSYLINSEGHSRGTLHLDLSC